MWNKQKDKEVDMLISELHNCARCQETHKPIGFYKFTNPHNNYTHWAMCPTLRESIMMFAEDVVEDPLERFKQIMSDGEDRILIAEN